MATNIEKVGRRYYLRGLPYAFKDIAKNAGCRFDPEQKAWWTGKEEVAQSVVRSLPVRTDSDGNESVSTSAPVIVGRARYKGKTYYVLAEGVSKAGKRYAKLAFRDGSKVFWVKDFTQFQMVKEYRDPMSIDAIKRFAEQYKRAGGGGRRYSQEYCFHICPVGGFKCCPENGPCHDCE